MIVDERITSYINSLNKDLNGVLKDIETEAIADNVPIIRKETREWLRTIMVLKKPVNVLEIGTAVGFSAIFMSQYIPENGNITTIENWKPRIEKAYENITRADVKDKITLLEGNAEAVLSRIEGEYDFIFVDAAKGQYINYLPDVLRLLRVGGVIISDNVLQDGEIVDSHFVIERRNRTIYSRMREYLYVLKNHEQLDTAIIPLGDGVAFSVKIC